MGLELTAVRTLSHHPIPLGHPSPLGKGRYLRAEHTVEHTVKVAIPTSNAVFPNCQLVFRLSAHLAILPMQLMHTGLRKGRLAVQVPDSPKQDMLTGVYVRRWRPWVKRCGYEFLVQRMGKTQDNV